MPILADPLCADPDLIRNALLKDCALIPIFAKAVNRHPRTVDRWTKQADGLPFTWMGNERIIHIPTARDWLMNRMRKPNPRRTAKNK
jgi:hypothetical protein